MVIYFVSEISLGLVGFMATAYAYLYNTHDSNS